MRLVLVCLLATISCFAQFESSEVLGTVRDASGSVISKANLTLVNTETGLQAKTQADDNGAYTFPNVKIGKYQVIAEATGFSKAIATVTVDVNARQRVDLTMQVGAVTESVEVTDAVSALETDSSEHGQVINTAQVVELPLNGRNYSDLALLSTNVHRSPLSVAFAVNGTPREGSFNVNGMR